MKFAIYCITKQEEKFVDRMMKSVIDDADEIVIVDTGSTDKTVALIQLWVDKYPEKVKLFHMHIKPWRFDMARNVSLAHVSADIDVALCLDLDEVMVKGWRQEIEKVWVPGETTRCTYTYIWSWNADGTPAVSFSTNKLHSRQGYDWYHPVHETLRAYMIEEKEVKSAAVMHHHPDDTKSRGQYLPLLELSVREAPYDDRNCFYLAREYTFYSMWEKAIAQFEVYRSLPTATWFAERGASWRLSGKSYLALGKQTEAIECYKQATRECPTMRESWADLAHVYYERGDWQNCYDTCVEALKLTVIPDYYITEREAYGAKVHDVMCVAAWNLGKKDEAIEECVKAISYEPYNDRFKANLEVMMKLRDSVA